MKRDSHLFLIRPQGDALAELAEIRDGAGSGGRPVRNALLHVTLAWFGYDTGDATLPARAARAAGGLRERRFRLVFDRLVGTDSRLLVVATEPLPVLDGLQRRLATALAGEGLRSDARWRFHPHVTLRYGRFSHVAGPILPVSWTVDALLLVRSEIGHGRHVELGRWPLDR